MQNLKALQQLKNYVIFKVLKDLHTNMEGFIQSQILLALSAGHFSPILGTA